MKYVPINRVGSVPRVSPSVWFFVISLPLNVVALGPLKYLMYLTPVIAMADCWLSRSKVIINRDMSLLALFWITTTLLASGFFHVPFDPKELTLLLACLSTFIFFTKHGYLDQYVLLLCCGFCLLLVTNEASEQLSLLKGGTLSTEHALGLAVPLLSIGFLKQKKFLSFFLTLLITLLYAKRVALLALLVSLLTSPDVLYGIRASYTVRFWRVLRVGFIVIIAISAFYAAQIYEIVSDLIFFMGVNISPNHLSSGRYDVLIDLQQFFEKRSLYESYFGSGAGYSRHLLEFMKLDHVHNDYLKIYLDHGLLSLIFCVLILCRLAWGQGVGAAIAVYTSVVLFTDNIFIYIYYWFFCMVSIKSDS